MDKRQPFSTLLEQYVLAVAASVIDSAAPDEQTDLIHFLHQINKTAADVDQPVDEMLTANDGLLEDSPFKQLEHQWQMALHTYKGELPQTTHPYLEQSIAMNQYQIRVTAFLVDQMKRLIKLTEDKISIHQSQGRLIAHYKTIYQQHAAYLTQLKALHEKSLVLLNK